MKVALVCPKYFPGIGGVEKVVKEVAERLSKSNVETHVICADGTRKLTQEVINGVNVTRFRSFHPGSAYFFAPEIKDFIERSDFDVVHAHNYHAFPALFASMAKGDHKFIFNPHYHGVGHTHFRNALHRPYKPFGSRIFERADKVVCVSETEKELVRNNFDVPTGKIIIIPNGVDLEGIRKSRPFEVGKKTVLYVGRLEKYKNIQLLVRAMAHLQNMKLKIIGNGSYANELSKLIERLKLSDRVELSQYLKDDEVYGWMKSCSVFVTLSDHEAFGMTVLEALAAGKPVIVNDRSNLSHFARMFDKQVFPIDIEKDGPRELARLIEQQSDLRIGLNLDDYSWSNVCNRLVALYKG